MDFETRAIHDGQEPDPATGAVTVPIYQTSTYVQEAVGHHKGYDYSRVANPTRTALQLCLASLEGAEHGEALDPRRMVERQTVGAVGPAVVSRDREALEAERPHDGEVVAGPRALRVRLVVCGRRRLRAVAVAAQIGGYDREIAGQLRRDRVPHDVRLRMPVQEQQRRPRAAVPYTDRRLARVDRR